MQLQTLAKPTSYHIGAQAERIYINSNATKLKFDAELSHQKLFNVLSTFRFVLSGQSLHRNHEKYVAVAPEYVLLRAIML